MINHDDSSFEYLKDLCNEINAHALHRLPITTFGFQSEAECRAESIKADPVGLNFLARVGGKAFPVQSNLLGIYNISNCLAAIAATVIGLDVSIDAVQAGIASMTGIPGRMERIDLGQDFLAIVDFAHTPHALRQALKTAREMLS